MLNTRPLNVGSVLGGPLGASFALEQALTAVLSQTNQIVTFEAMTQTLTATLSQSNVMAATFSNRITLIANLSQNPGARRSGKIFADIQNPYHDSKVS